MYDYCGKLLFDKKNRNTTVQFYYIVIPIGIDNKYISRRVIF